MHARPGGRESWRRDSGAGGGGGGRVSRFDASCRRAKQLVFVHALVGLLDQVGKSDRVRGVAGAQADADGDTIGALRGRVELIDRRPKSFAKDVRVIARVRRQDDEFVAAETTDDVGGAKAGAQDPREVHQEAIAFGVSKGIVDPLHAVQVDEEDGRVVPGLPRGLERRTGDLHEAAPVVDARERVGRGLLLELEPCGPRIRDVPSDLDGTAHRPVRIEQRFGVHAVPAPVRLLVRADEELDVPHGLAGERAHQRQRFVRDESSPDPASRCDG